MIRYPLAFDWLKEIPPLISPSEQATTSAMALSSTASLCISHSADHIGLPSPPTKSGKFRSSSTPFRLSSNNWKFSIRSSSAEAAPEAVSESSAENNSEAPLEPSKEYSEYSSLISVSNVEKALRGIGNGALTSAAITTADHYRRLGIARGTSYEQVTVAYKKKCEELMNRELEEKELGKKMELLKESYSILSSEEERRLYDWSLARSEKAGRYVWPFEVDITQTPTQPPPPKEPEDVGPTRLVGYFFLGWFVLSVVLSIALYR